MLPVSAAAAASRQNLRLAKLRRFAAWPCLLGLARLTGFRRPIEASTRYVYPGGNPAGSKHQAAESAAGGLVPSRLRVWLLPPLGQPSLLLCPPPPLLHQPLPPEASQPDHHHAALLSPSSPLCHPHPRPQEDMAERE